MGRLVWNSPDLPVGWTGTRSGRGLTADRLTGRHRDPFPNWTPKLRSARFIPSVTDPLIRRVVALYALSSATAWKPMSVRGAARPRR